MVHGESSLISGRPYYYNRKTKITQWHQPYNDALDNSTLTSSDNDPLPESPSLPSEKPEKVEGHVENTRLGSKRLTCINFRDLNVTNATNTQNHRKSFSDLPHLSISNKAAFLGAKSVSPTSIKALPKHADPNNNLLEYAAHHFVVFKRGLFRITTPVDKAFIHTKKMPIAPMHKNIVSDAAINSYLLCYEMLLVYMDDRKFKETTQQFKEVIDSEAKCNGFDLIKALLTQLFKTTTIRDEIIVSVCKQCIKNTTGLSSVLKGIQLLALLLSCFPPTSLELQGAILHFLQKDLVNQEINQDIKNFALLAEKRFRQSSTLGPRKTIPSDPEIRSVTSVEPPQPVFGVTIDEYMEWQKKKFPNVDQKSPYVLVVIVQELEKINGLKTEGIFRLPGNTKKVEELKDRFLRGDLSIEGKTDPHVLASVFKLWLRELMDPIVPNDLYESFVDAAPTIEGCVTVLPYLPTNNSNILAFVIRFLSRMCDEDIASKTMMDMENLAVVFSPNILRNQSTDPFHIMKNSNAEKQFVKNLIKWKLGRVDEDE
ncbi:Rho GTPase-activating protein ArhGAP [Acrasis kona]|uniref:Rho GTPase-activating protein ArhGAP n=1 Tax=Acrasis kona TaxID=1008807 RepID=A0AAW2YGC5_9EUKA